MTKRSSRSKQRRREEAAAADGKGEKPRKADSAAPTSRWRLPSPAAIRETIESVAIAFVLAFLFRTFEVEAFVIPTGSMAPTLMGRHKDLECPVCGFPFQVSASEEVDQVTGAEKGLGSAVVGCTCPMCRYPIDVGQENPQKQRYPSFKGDRILVGKFAYQFSEPKPWDVAVFHFPGGAETNYIKRLVGLPEEVLRIEHGDIYVGAGQRQEYVGTENSAGYQIARKPPKKLLAMLQPVFDNDLIPQMMRRIKESASKPSASVFDREVVPKIEAAGWPVPRWTPDAPGAWEAVDDYRTYKADGRSGEAWLRYHHLVPTWPQWQAVLGLRPWPKDPEGREQRRLRPEVISDFSGYNTSRNPASQYSDPADDGDAPLAYPVGDLALECTLQAKSAEGQVVFELVKGGRAFQCHIDLGSGRATLLIDGSPTVTADGRSFTYQPTAKKPVQWPGTHTIRFSNCDEQLLLWVDGDLMVDPRDTGYPPLNNYVPQKPPDSDPHKPSDLAPVGIASRGADVEVSNLKIFRDIYYIAEPNLGLGAIHQLLINPHSDFSQGLAADSPTCKAIRKGLIDSTVLKPPRQSLDREGLLHRLLCEPKSWSDVYARLQPSQDYKLEAGQFLALGDNSGKSLDSRLWPTKTYRDLRLEEVRVDYFVRREFLVGEAFFIYWPHSWDWPVPYFPNFSRMGFVR